LDRITAALIFARLARVVMNLRWRLLEGMALSLARVPAQPEQPSRHENDDQGARVHSILGQGVTDAGLEGRQ
jgi:hypothetical protein